MTAIDFHDDKILMPVENFNDHYLGVFDLTAMQDATENRCYPLPNG